MKKLAGLCLMVVLAGGGGVCYGQAQAKGRTYSGSHFFLELGGQQTAVKRLDGGDITAPVVQNGPKKQLGPVQYGEFEVQVGLTGDKGLQEWIKAMASGKPTRNSGAVIAADFNYEAKTRREFTDAVLTEVMFPALEGSSKDAAYLTLKFAPQVIKVGAASGKVSSDLGAKQKQWVASNFKLSIDGVDCSKVSKIDAITIRQGSKSEQGMKREVARSSGAVEYANLKVSVSAASAQSWIDWHKSFVIEGKNGDKEEKSGTLEFLDPSMKTALVTIKFQNMGICSLSEEAVEANVEQVRRLEAEIYFEGMTVEFGEAKK